jgi:hypothetical protein
MEWIEHNPYTPPTVIPGLPAVIAGIVLSDAERKQINASRDVFARVESIGMATCPPANWNNFQCQLGDLEREAYNQLAENPTPENAEKYHGAVMRYESSAKSADQIAEALEVSRVRERAALLIVCNAILDRCQTFIDTEAKRHTEAISGTMEHPVFGGIEDAWATRIKDIQVALSGERAQARKDSFNWLSVSGFFDQAAAPTKAKK